MRAWVLGCLLLLPAAGLAAGEPAGSRYSRPAVRKELEAVVGAQLAAFRAGDFAAAYRFASGPFRLQFTLKEFTAMVTRTYPLIAHNVRAEFGLPVDDGTSATVPVRVIGPGGKSESYRYLLAREAQVWRISGVLPGEPSGPAA